MATRQTRSAISKRTWRRRRRTGGKAADALTGEPIYAGGVIHRGKHYHKLSWAALQWARKLHLSPDATAKVALATLGYSQSSSRRNPSTWPPAAWMVHVRPQFEAQYPSLASIKRRRPGGECSQSRTYQAAINCIIAGVWHSFSHTTKVRLTRQYEGETARLNPVCPVCPVCQGQFSSSVSGIGYCSGCGASLSIV